MTLWVGIDLGTIKPAAAVIDCSNQRPLLLALHTPVYSARKHGDITHRVILWQRELTDFLTPYATRVSGAGIEYSSGTHWGKSERAKTNYHSNRASITALFAAEFACSSLGIRTEKFPPQTLSKTIGLGKVRCATEKARRELKKQRTIRLVRIRVDGLPDDMDDNAADAIAAAMTMARKNPDWRALTKERMEA